MQPRVNLNFSERSPVEFDTHRCLQADTRRGGTTQKVLWNQQGLMGRSLHLRIVTKENTKMKRICAANETSNDFAHEKHLLIWIGIWIVALLALFPR
jgi:hypothetical protein